MTMDPTRSTVQGHLVTLAEQFPDLKEKISSLSQMTYWMPGAELLKLDKLLADSQQGEMLGKIEELRERILTPRSFPQPSSGDCISPCSDTLENHTILFLGKIPHPLLKQTDRIVALLKYYMPHIQVCDVIPITAFGRQVDAAYVLVQRSPDTLQEFSTLIHHRFTIQNNENDYLLIPSESCEGEIIGETAHIPFTATMAEQTRDRYNAYLQEKRAVAL